MIIIRVKEVVTHCLSALPISEPSITNMKLVAESIACFQDNQAHIIASALALYREISSSQPLMVSLFLMSIHIATQLIYLGTLYNQTGRHYAKTPQLVK